MNIYCFFNHPNNVLQEMVLNDQKAEAVTELIGFRTGRFYTTGINRLFFLETIILILINKLYSKLRYNF